MKLAEGMGGMLGTGVLMMVLGATVDVTTGTDVGALMFVIIPVVVAGGLARDGSEAGFGSLAVRWLSLISLTSVGVDEAAVVAV